MTSAGIWGIAGDDRGQMEVFPIGTIAAGVLAGAIAIGVQAVAQNTSRQEFVAASEQVTMKCAGVFGCGSVGVFVIAAGLAVVGLVATVALRGWSA